MIDDATRRVTGGSRTLFVRTSVPLASLWLAPRLPKFARAHPEIDMRVTASNDLQNMDREHIDVAIRYVPTGTAVLAGSKLFDVDMWRGSGASPS
jgi:DNA-binding transcriptional LysR family regulator